jgi:hypothetical protein
MPKDLGFQRLRVREQHVVLQVNVLVQLVLERRETLVVGWWSSLMRSEADPPVPATRHLGTTAGSAAHLTRTALWSVRRGSEFVHYSFDEHPDGGGDVLLHGDVVVPLRSPCASQAEAARIPAPWRWALMDNGWTL